MNCWHKALVVKTTRADTLPPLRFNFCCPSLEVARLSKLKNLQRSAGRMGILTQIAHREFSSSGGLDHAFQSVFPSDNSAGLSGQPTRGSKDAAATNPLVLRVGQLPTDALGTRGTEMRSIVWPMLVNLLWKTSSATSKRLTLASMLARYGTSQTMRSSIVFGCPRQEKDPLDPSQEKDPLDPSQEKDQRVSQCSKYQEEFEATRRYSHG